MREAGDKLGKNSVNNIIPPKATKSAAERKWYRGLFMVTVFVFDLQSNGKLTNCFH